MRTIWWARGSLLSAVLLAGCASPAPVALSSLTALQQEQTVEEEGDEWDEWEERENAIALFVGYATERAGGGGAKIGIDYERALTDAIGVGGFVNYVSGDFDVGVVGLLLYWHAWDDVVLFGGPGMEGRSEEVNGKKYAGLLRLGALYEIQVADRWAVAPVAMVDLLEGEPDVWIFGMDLIYGF